MKELHLSPEQIKKNDRRNLMINCVQAALGSVSGGAFSAQVMTIFFLSAGITEAQLAYRSTVLTAIGTAMFFLATGFSTSVKRPTRTYFLLTVIPPILSLLYLLLRVPAVSGGIAFWLTLAVVILCRVPEGLGVNLSHRLSAETISADTYIKLYPLRMIISGAVGIPMSLFVSYLFTTGMDPVFLCMLGCIVSSAVSLVSCLLTLWLRPICALETEEHRQNVFLSVGRLFADRQFRFLLLPHLFFGFTDGIVALYLILAIRDLGLTDAQTALVATVTQAASFCAAFAYEIIGKRMRPHTFVLLSGFLFFAFFFCLFGGPVFFFVCLFVAWFGYYWQAFGSSNTLFRFVPKEQLADFMSWRSILALFGSFVFTALAGLVMDIVPGYVILLAGALSGLLGGVFYYLHYRRATPIY